MEERIQQHRQSTHVWPLRKQVAPSTVNLAWLQLIAGCCHSRF